ncbi:MAG: hypothetical protein FJ098_03030 [Deltaproteobacteria bacterium]|nr:hypothetical protein [Deltaproteobacteria bacterium]
MEATIRTFAVAHIAPIPVGHRIEVRFFAVERGVFKKTRHVSLDQPSITDLDTGIVYGSTWHHAEELGVSTSAFDPKVPPTELRTNLVTEEVVSGRVVACRLHTVMGGTTWRVQTTVSIQV